MAFFSCVSVYADVTQIYVVRLQPSKALTPELAEQVAKQFSATSDSLGYDTRIKGSRALVRMGTFLTLSDFDGALLTVIDRPSKRFSTISPDEYQRAWKSLMSGMKEAGPKAAMAIDDKIHATGKKRTIHGIETAEHQFTMSMSISENDKMSVRLSLWAPTQEEQVRHPALLELQRYADRAYVPAGFISEMTKSMDSSGTGFRELAETMKSVGQFLELRVAYTPPGMEGEPIFEMVQELIEFSTDEIPEVVFAIPRDYAPTAIGELLPDVMSAALGKPGDVKAPVMRPGTEDPVPDPNRPKLQRSKP